MAPSDRPNYLRAAFLNVYNLSLVAGAAVASMATSEYVLGAVALGAEALWLLLGPDFHPFKRYVDQDHRKEAERQDRARMKALMEALPERDGSRARALDELRRDIERDMQQNPSFQAILLQPELDKLHQLNLSFVTLATGCARAESYLAATDRRDVQRQIEIQKGVERNMADPAVKEIARKNVLVLEKRLGTIGEIQNFLARARGQMNLIENSVRLLRDQILTMASPDQLAEQLDDLLVGVDAIQATARDHETLLNDDPVGMQPISPLPEGDGAVPGNRTRTRD